MSDDKKSAMRGVRKGPIHDDAAFVRDLATILDETNLTEIEVERGDLKIRVSREVYMQAAPAAYAPPALPAASAPAAASGPLHPAGAAESAPSANPADHPGAVKSPMVGTAYLAPEPGAANFVSPGDQVAQGQTLMIVEAMKVMNPIPAPKAGRIKEIFVSNAQAVEYGEPLLIIE